MNPIWDRGPVVSLLRMFVVYPDVSGPHISQVYAQVRTDSERNRKHPSWLRLIMRPTFRVIPASCEASAKVGLQSRQLLFSREGGNPETSRTTTYSSRDSRTPAFAGEHPGFAEASPRAGIQRTATSTSRGCAAGWSSERAPADGSGKTAPLPKAPPTPIAAPTPPPPSS